MRLRIVRPLPSHLEGLDISHLGFGGAYEIGTPLSDLLLINGYGIPEDEPQIDPAMAVQASPAANVGGAPHGVAVEIATAADKPVKSKRRRSRQKISKAC